MRNRRADRRAWPPCCSRAVPQGMGCSPSRQQHPAGQGVGSGVCEVDEREQSTRVAALPEQRPGPMQELSQPENEPEPEPEQLSQLAPALSMGLGEPQMKLARVKELDRELDTLLASGDDEIGKPGTELSAVAEPALELDATNTTYNVLPRPTSVPPLDLSKIDRSLRHHVSGDAAQKSNQIRTRSSVRDRPRSRADWHVAKMRQYREPPCHARYPAALEVRAAN